MGLLAEVKQVWAQRNDPVCFFQPGSQSGAAVTGQVLELDTSLDQVQVSDPPGGPVAALGGGQVHNQKRAPIDQGQTRLPPLENLVSLAQDRQRRR
jgi:hypothetical protein